MNDTRDVDAAKWLHWQLRTALLHVDERQGRVDIIRRELDEANQLLGEAVALADAIRLIVAMAPLPLVEVPEEEKL